MFAGDVSSIQMTFDGEGPISEETSVIVERGEGVYGVTCQAAGFNPSATLRIFLGDEEQTTGGTEIMYDDAVSEEVGARRYKAFTTAPNVKLSASNSGQKLRCEARASYAEDTPMLVASVPLQVIAC